MSDERKKLYFHIDERLCGLCAHKEELNELRKNILKEVADGVWTEEATYCYFHRRMTRLFTDAAPLDKWEAKYTTHNNKQVLEVRWWSWNHEYRLLIYTGIPPDDRNAELYHKDRLMGKVNADHAEIVRYLLRMMTEKEMRELLLSYRRTKMPENKYIEELKRLVVYDPYLLYCEEDYYAWLSACRSGYRCPTSYFQTHDDEFKIPITKNQAANWFNSRAKWLLGKIYGKKYR